MDFERHVDKVLQIGKFDENKSRPIRLVIKTLDGKKQILVKCKSDFTPSRPQVYFLRTFHGF